ncbi:32646_t:CDS:1 [Gigaspora margarita]|uniref:32646_t:CDS:1 n=1 Tax=Gigaspora margarita TaxID=4874 RepID=A0ABN7W134_GIGMA|nr:32646_t:CDS:1 [Gigaspora margarita]
MQKQLMISNIFLIIAALLVWQLKNVSCEITTSLKSDGIILNKRLLNAPGECVGNLTRRNHPSVGPLGCYIRNSSFTIDTLNGLANLNFSDTYQDQDGNLMDPGLCIIHCADYFFTFAALTNGNQCKCGNKTGLDAYTKLTNDSSVNQTCNIKCVGNTSYICGGENGYTVYNALTSISSYIAPTIDINQKLEIIHNINKNVRYKGCYKDSLYCNQRLLNGTSEDVAGMTVESCLTYCWQKNYTYAGLEIGSQCFCDNEYDSLTRLSIDECSSSCEGNNSEICGGPLALSIYNASNYGLVNNGNSPVNNDNNKGSSNLNIGGIVGGIIGVIVVISALIFLAVRIYRQRSQGRKEVSQDPPT